MDSLAARQPARLPFAISMITGGEWKSYPASLRAYEVLDSCALFNLTDYKLPEGNRRIFELRSYITQQKEWTVLQLDNRPDTGFEYQSGNFEHGQIELKQNTDSKDEPSLVLKKTRWTSIGSDEVGYELCESSDGGNNWDIKATIELTRK